MELDEQPFNLQRIICGYGEIRKTHWIQDPAPQGLWVQFPLPAPQKMKGIKNMPPRKREPKKLTNRELINLYFDGKVAMTNIHNVMGCNESWYDKYYAITHTFKREDIDAMDDKQLENLLKLAETIQEALY